MASRNYGQNTIPSSDKMVGDERVGFVTSGYINKRDTPYGENARFNWLPPGQNINDQYCADLRDLPMKEPMTTGYAGDGWEGSNPGTGMGKQLDMGEAPSIALPLAGRDNVK